MNRRAFITSVAAGVLGPRINALITPSPSPAPAERPAPIDLGEGIVLIDYRVYPGDRPAVIGEIRNDNDHMVDAPVMSLRWPDAPSTSDFAWVPPLIPVISPGGSVPIFGMLPPSGAPDKLVPNAHYALCSPVVAGKYTNLEKALDLQMVILDEKYEDDSYHATCELTNVGEAIAADTMARIIVRDAEGRIAGTGSDPYVSRLKPNEPRELSLWAGTRIENKANPAPFMQGRNYTVEISAGTRSPVVAQGCTFGFPWE